MGASLLVDGTLYFFRRDSLWRTDFTSAGTWKVHTPGIPVCSVALGERFVVRTLPDVGEYAELWISDGIRSGSERVSHMGSKWSAEATCTSLGNGRALVGVGGAAPALWTTDGTSAGTARLTESCSSPDCGLTVIGDRAFFVRSSGFEREELWTTDGTAAGTVRVFARESGNGFVIDGLTACGGRLYFFGGWVTDPEGLEPWVSDGTAAGTHVLADTLPGRHVEVKARTCIDGTLVWLEQNEQRLWRSNGTAAGTTSYRSMAATSTSAVGPGEVLGGALIFSASGASNERSLWRSDGTLAGTWELQSPAPLMQPVPRDFVRFARAACFHATGWMHASSSGPRASVPSRERAREQGMEQQRVKNFDRADEVRPFRGKGHADILQFEKGTVGRGVYEPGWKWSENLKPIAGTDTCMSSHSLYIVSGRMHVRMDDGTELELGPGDVGIISPGHDAWVVGDESCVLIDFSGMEHYAQPSRGERVEQVAPSLH